MNILKDRCEYCYEFEEDCMCDYDDMVVDRYPCGCCKCCGCSCCMDEEE